MELLLNGYVSRDYDDHPTLTKDKTLQKYLEEFRIGGHDLNNEFEDHISEYCWIRITTN